MEWSTACVVDGTAPLPSATMHEAPADLGELNFMAFSATLSSSKTAMEMQDVSASDDRGRHSLDRCSSATTSHQSRHRSCYGPRTDSACIMACMRGSESMGGKRGMCIIALLGVEHAWG